ncbi:MmgE/PrpD family protein [Blastococcus sp. SYSU D00669]
MDETRTLAGFAHGLRLADVPDTTRHLAKRAVLDQVGCQIGCAHLPWSQQVLRTTLDLGSSGPCLVMATGHRLRPDDAAFVNSSFGAANEIDDAHTGVRTHPGAVVVPAVLAVAEAQGSTGGTDVLLAAVVGYEVLLRVAWAGFPLLMARHHHTSVSAGPFGSAAAAARLLGLDADGTRHALAIAGSHSGGQMEYTESGGSVKRILTAIGAAAGVRAGYFAQHGMTGPVAVLEGNRGFLEAFADRQHVDRLVDGLGDTWLLDGAGPKGYFAEYRIHAPLQALEHLMATHGLTVADIDSMSVGTSSVTVEAVGTIVVPTDPLGAQFSMRFALALAARHGADRLRAVTPDDLRDGEVAALARRIEVHVDPRIDAEKWRSFGGVLTVRTTSGATYTCHQPAPIGSPENPMSDDRLSDKFRSLVEPVLGTAACGSLLSALWNLEDVDVAADVLAHVTPAGR